MKLPRLSVLLLSVVALAGFSACGAETPANTAKSEGQYVELGGVQYQVQLSRILNPADIEDRDYLTGLSPEDKQLPADTDYFAVFLRAKNQEGVVKQTASQFRIEDTQKNVFEPLPAENALAYKPVRLSGHGRLPDPNAITASAPSQGQVLVFQVPTASLDNRPLVFFIKDPEGGAEEASITLDV